MPRIVTWPDEQTTKSELSKRLNNAKDFRRKFEKQWEYSERILQNTRGSMDENQETSLSFESKGEMGQAGEDQSVGVNYTFKNLRFIHSQLSANPPTVIARPASNDAEDSRRADAADRVIRHAIRQYQLQEKFDSVTLNCLYYGTAYMKVINDPNKGEIMEVDDEGNLLMEGDLSISVPSPWNIYIDPEADTWGDVKWVIERMFIPWEEALFQFPDKQKVLEKARKKEITDGNGGSGDTQSDTAIYDRKYDVVEVYQYWEKGLPHNGMQGRFGYFLYDGTPLSPVVRNPHSFSTPSASNPEKDSIPIAELPYHIITDLDVPSSVMGKATVDYEAPLQDVFNQMTNVMLDSLRAHGVARLILPQGAEVSDESITNSPWDIIRITGNYSTAPQFMEPMPFPSSFSEMLNLTREGIDASAGVNDSMFGEMKRETSGFSLQYATNQGNMIRRRLFNKYVLLTESVYKTILSLVRKHWTTPRKIKVLGTEKAFNVYEIDSTDLRGGFDLVAEYGASLSLDPTTRREEILTLMPLFEKAGVDTPTILGMLKLTELDGLYDLVKLAADRQYEVFKEMIDTELYVEPEEMQDHRNMLTYAYRYVMTSEFKYLKPDVKTLIVAHIKEREQLAARGPAGAPGTPPGVAEAPPIEALAGLMGG